jgi:hypothetical protein
MFFFDHGVDIDPALLNLLAGFKTQIPPQDQGVSADTHKMKAHELLSSSDNWCQEALAKDADGDNIPPFHPEAVQWCALAALQRVYPPPRWEDAVDRVLRALSVSEKGIKQLSESDKACCLMEWNDQPHSSYWEIREILLEADV